AEEAPAPEVLPEVVPAAEAPSERFELLTAPRGAPDDLAKLHGVGPQIVKKLNDAGIFHYWQIAALSPEDATKLDQDLKLGGRLERDDWIAHARILIAA
ncbi:MAG: 30S ribosomal protein S2, partial [Methylovirgula sp.]